MKKFIPRNAYERLFAKAMANLDTDTRHIERILELSYGSMYNTRCGTRELRVKEHIMLILASHYSNEYQNINPKALEEVLEVAAKHFASVMGDRGGR